MERKKGRIISRNGTKLAKAIKDIQKDAKAMAEIRKFIKITTGVYNLRKV